MNRRSFIQSILAAGVAPYVGAVPARIAEIKAEILSYIEPKPYAFPTDHEVIGRAANSMRLFERDGMIAYGTWRRWWRATPQEGKAILKAFKAGNQRSTTPSC